ncbi:MAG: PQQ-dependent sugar dehydrogenase [Trueperaceae bacterium]|nr:PQQ-dependent sugar dehydrogenase [Trueperaceae bacterium]MCO5174839.1 PQQ-dependent sugar dehydrogenase [Trueperaceae bacterium]MCW5818609.1 PQQ-dependent sugar dehydrogenase [Trueperaceae bacterium]
MSEQPTPPQRRRGFRGYIGALTALAFTLALAACTQNVVAQRLVPVADGLRQPVVITNAGDERLFVAEQSGAVRIVSGGELLREPFLDLSGELSTGGERGLLGLAFPADYQATGRFYVYYTGDGGQTVLSRFTVTPGNPDRADPESEEVLLTQAQPYSNHNGGQIVFGPDGYLYVGLGDGGSGGDPQGNGQDLGTFLGKLLRLDVSGDTGYTVPSDNPFVDRDGALPEIWAYGLRNPWRFSFDRGTGDLYIADVGQEAYEEVNFTPAGTGGGLNYGWKLMEGLHCYAASSCDQAGLTLPVLEYPHGPQWGTSITGGYVYRGADVPALQGNYVFADFVSGRVWSTSAADGWAPRPLFETGFNVSTFGEDAAGELYVAAYDSGMIYRVGQ